MGVDLRRVGAAVTTETRGHDILCISSIDWDHIWQGHQEIMSTLAAQGHRVLFLENTGVRSPNLRDLPRLRQRIRTGVLESSSVPCPHCGGSGHVRSVSSVALQLLRGIEEILMKGATHNLVVRTRTDVAL